MIRLALVIEGIERDTISIKGQEFSLVKPLAVGTLLWTGSQSGGIVQMPGIVKDNWHNVNGVQVELLDRIPSKDRPDLIASTYIDTSKLAFSPVAPFKISREQLVAKAPLLFNEVTKSTDFTYYSNGSRTGEILRHGSITFTPGSHDISISVKNIDVYSTSTGVNISNTYVLTVGRITAY